MKFRSVFDIIGPVMIGPSSSHTAGAARIGRAARSIFGRKPEKAVITFFGSFAQTYRGHGTDIAIVGGLLDFDTFDERMPDSLDIAQKEGIEIRFETSEDIPDHPNTARIYLEDQKGSVEVVGISIGGGKIELTELNGFELKLSGENPTLLVLHKDQYGAVAKVATILANHKINIAYMQVARKDKGAEALMSIETDHNISQEVVNEIEKQDGIYTVTVL